MDSGASSEASAGWPTTPQSTSDDDSYTAPASTVAAATTTTAGTSTPVTLSSNRRKPIPRKGHKKSRAGCAQCKRRKVKCDEKTPNCGQCQRLHLTCQYTMTITTARPIVQSNITIQPRTTPNAFSIHDLRYFQHFLTEAYPPLPISGKAIWQQISQMVDEYEFLARAVLALGASHLTVMGTGEHSNAALHHRVTAIARLNEHMPNAHLNQAHADAAFAAMISLTFQAAYMPDGLQDFLTMVRGCFLVGAHIIPGFRTSNFRSLAEESYFDKVKELISREETDQSLDPRVADEFCASTKQLSPLCQGVVEVEYLATMNRIATLAVMHPAQGYCEHTAIYNKLGDLSAEEFAKFIDPENHVARLVLVHILVLDFLMSRKLIDGENKQPNTLPNIRTGYNSRKSIAITWIQRIYDDLPDEYRAYAEWALHFSRRLLYIYETAGQVWKPFSYNLPDAEESGQVLPASKGFTLR